MADDISFKATLDDTQVVASAARMDGAVKKASSSIQAEFQRINVSQQKIGSGGGGNGGYRLGQTALQAQDVAVSLQSGAKFATVLAQQGSQIASIFGPTGQLVGGVIAVGASLATWALSLHATATQAELLEERMKRFEAKQEKIRNLGDLASHSIGSNFNEDQDLEARIKGGAMAEKEVKLDRERNREIQQTYDLMTDLVMAGGALSNEEEMSWMTTIERKHGAQAILQISERIASVMQKIGAGENAAAGAAQGRLAIEKEMSKLEEDHLDKFSRQEEKFEKMNKSARALLEHVKDFGNEMTKGLDKFLGNFDKSAQFRQSARTWLAGGAAAVKKADDLMDPAGAKARRRQENKERIADRTIAEREVNKLDRENGGMPGHHRLSPAERKAAVDARVRRAHDLRHPQKVSIDPVDIEKLANSMMAAAAQQNAK